MNVDTEDLEEGWAVLEVAMVIECLDDQGRVRLVQRYTDGMTPWKALGMFRLASATQEASMVAHYINEDDEDEDDS